MRSTLFAIPKAFTGHTALIQENAIRSWRALDCAPTVVLFGDEAGVREVAGDYGLIHVAQVTRNANGTPFLSDVFDRLKQVSPADAYCYVNGDIILMNDFSTAWRVLCARPALLVGRRWNLEVTQPLDTTVAGWQDALRRRAMEEGQLFLPSGIDYFAFPAEVEWEMPPFLVGRPAWDNWMIFRALQKGLDVIDLTPSVLAVHQNHDYAHIPDRSAERTYGAEGEYNLSLFPCRGAYSVHDASHLLYGDALQPATYDAYLWKRVFTLRHPDDAGPWDVLYRRLRAKAIHSLLRIERRVGGLSVRRLAHWLSR